jgi:23S rRNA (adenine2503-C2)-methyltransferase
MFSGNAMKLETFAKIAEKFEPPVGRKYTLNFALASDYIVDATKLANMFNSEHWMCKITPIHNNEACKANGIETKDGYIGYDSYREVENNLIRAGFDTLVFIPSMDEENGLVTCGNAVLSGTKIKTNEVH